MIIPLGRHRVSAATVYTYTGTTALQSGGASTYQLVRGFLTGLTETWEVPNAVGTLDGVLNWDDYIGGHNWSVVGGTAQLAGPTTTAGGRLVGSLPTSNYQVTATITDWHDSGAGVMAFGPCARMQGDTSVTFYATTLLTVDGVSTCILQRFLNGTPQTIGGPVTVTPHAPMTLTTRVQGNRITALVDGVAAFPMVLDNLIPTGLYWGMEGYMTVDNRVNVGQIVAGNANVTPIHYLMGLRPLSGVA